MNCECDIDNRNMLSQENSTVTQSITTFKCESSQSYETESWKSTLSQFLASLVTSITFAQVGFLLAIPTIIIGELRNSRQGFSISDTESSWYGSLLYSVQPIGCVAGSMLQPFIGRKFGMIMMNIPEFISWIVLYLTHSTSALYCSALLMGISIGFVEAPGITYIGEIAQPRVRGTFSSMASIAVAVGMLIEYGLGSVIQWRILAALSATFPVINIGLILLIPESPLWLLKKGREKEALKSLCWVRGWVSEDQVKQEFEELGHYIRASKSDQNDKNSERNSVGLSMMKPLMLVTGFHFFNHCASLVGVRNDLVPIFRQYNVLKPEKLVFFCSIFMLVGGIVCILSVKYVGKRKLSLISMMICSINCIILSWYTFYMNNIQLPWIPTITFCVLNFGMSLGIGPLIWSLTSEIFPVRSRSLGAGLGAATYYILAFVFTKTFVDLKKIISLSGCFLLYGCGGLIGFLFLYCFLPETEGRTLAEIEEYFSSHSGKKQMRRGHHNTQEEDVLHP